MKEDSSGTAADDGRLSFDEAVAHVVQRKAAAFAVTPVFEDDQEAAAGARVFVLQYDGKAGHLLRFVAGPFFSAAFAANERIPPDEIPASVRELRFMPTRVEESWFSGQVQLLIQKLVKGSGTDAPQMPDYEKAPSYRAGEEVVFPIANIGRSGDVKH